MSMGETLDFSRRQLTRRQWLKFGMAGGATLVGARAAFASGGGGGGGNDIIPHAPDCGTPNLTGGGQGAIEAWPVSPLLLQPFTDPLPIPRALAPVPAAEVATWRNQPGPEAGRQDSYGSTHQIWPNQLGYPSPLIYQIKLQVSTHSFTSSQVLPIGKDGRPVASFDAQGTIYPAGATRTLPASTIYGFNGTFPGPRINAEYGRPCLVRFENHLDENPLCLERGDFGAPDWAFLTHLHNGHTAPESDGNPHYRPEAYQPGQFVDNLYLNYPAGAEEHEKQSFFWFHDHRMDHTGANVYKGMVGLFPIYDPKNNLDMGDETQGLRLPGVRTNNPDGSFDVEYDIPLAFYDCRLEDGYTPHQDFHNGLGETHPRWWGKTFFRHFPNHGFVGDIFTVNGTAYPVLEVKRRKYRLRFLCASISRIYEFKLMSSSGGPQTAYSLGYKDTEAQGQYRILDGQQCMKFTQVAAEGGLLPKPIVRDSFELWPAKRREFIVDFTKYMDGSPTRKGDVIYLTNVMKMMDGRLWNSSTRFSPDPNYKVPVLKIVIGDDAPDNSVIPTALRPAPPYPADLTRMMAKRRVFELQRGSGGGEVEWLINSRPFDPTVPLAYPKQGSYECWEIRNGGGGWVHPMHLHMEEHRVVRRNGVNSPDAGHPDDVTKEDVIALDPGESVIVCRGFRTFTGPYVAHCHNLAHEDHAMMFGWTIVP
jgi:FtsP/CotA-like multicopper oxidase with cupredoxin domain